MNKKGSKNWSLFFAVSKHRANRIFHKFTFSSWLQQILILGDSSHTCGNGCLYCYANQDGIPVGRGSALHDPASPLLVGRLSADDEVTDQRCASLKSRQFSLL